MVKPVSKDIIQNFYLLEVDNNIPVAKYKDVFSNVFGIYRKTFNIPINNVRSHNITLTK